MVRFALRDSTAPAIRRAAADAIAGAASREPGDQAAAIHHWIRAHVRFVPDSKLAARFSDSPEEAEVLVPPVDVLDMRRPEGDCDDFSMLAAAMLLAAGIPAAFVTVAADEHSPDYSHVYVRAYLPAGAALDASHGPTFGWESKPKGKIRVWPIGPATTMQRPQLSGLGFDWDAFSGVLNTGIKSAAGILGPRYAVPQLAPGQYIQNGNQIMYQQPAGGSAAFGLPIAGGPGGNTMLYMIGGAVLLAVLLLKK
jgi:hypothetical protein